MPEGADVFDATIRAVDQATGPLAKVMASVRGLSGLSGVLAAHGRGIGEVFKAAFAEMEHGAHEAGHAAAHAGHETAHGAHAAGSEIKKAGHAAEHAGHQIEHAAHGRNWMALAGHIRLMRGHFGELNASVGELGSTITEFLPALGAIGAAGGLVGLFEMTEHAADAFSELSKGAIQAGLTVQAFTELSYAAKMTDVPVEAMTNSMFKLNKTMGDAASGKNKNVASLFEHLKIELRDSSGHIRTVNQVLPELATAFKNTADPALRARAAMALFGKAGEQMLPLLMAGGAELEELSEQARKVVFTPDQEGQKGLEEYHRSMVSLGAAVQSFSMEIGTKLAPVLRPVIEMATEWVTANRDWISTGIAAKVGELAGWIEKLDIKGFVEQMKDWGSQALSFGKSVGGMTTVVGAFALALGSPLIGAITSAIAIVGTLGTVLRGLSALAWANPLIAAAALVGLAGYELYEHWDWVAGKLGDIWRGFMQNEWVQAVIAAIRPFLHVPETVRNAWSSLQSFFEGLWSGVESAFNSAWQRIEPIVNALKDAVTFVQNGWVGRQIGIDHPAGGAPAAPHGAAPNAPLDPAASDDLLRHELRTPLSSAAPAAAPAAVAQNGTVDVNVRLENLPPGSTVRSSSGGIAAPPDIDVGYAYAGMAGAY